MLLDELYTLIACVLRTAGDGLKIDGLRTSGVSMKGCLQRCAETW